MPEAGAEVGAEPVAEAMPDADDDAPQGGKELTAAQKKRLKKKQKEQEKAKSGEKADKEASKKSGKPVSRQVLEMQQRLAKIKEEEERKKAEEEERRKKEEEEERLVCVILDVNKIFLSHTPYMHMYIYKRENPSNIVNACSYLAQSWLLAGKGKASPSRRTKEATQRERKSQKGTAQKGWPGCHCQGLYY